MKIPKCEYSSDCEKIAYLVKSTPQSLHNEDLFVCSKCLNSRFVSEPIVQIPNPGDILYCLEAVEHNLLKIDHFREWHNLDKLWSNLLPELREYKDIHAQLKNDLASAKATNGWDRLPYLHVEARALLETVLESRLWKEYCKEDSIRQFRDNQYGTRKMYSASKKWVNGQMIKLRDHLNVTRYGELKEEHKNLKKQYEQKSELCDEKQQEIDRHLRKLQTQDLKILSLSSEIAQTKKKFENAEQIMIKQENSLSEDRKRQEQEKNKFIQDLEAITQDKIKLEQKLTKDKERIKENNLLTLEEKLTKAEELRLESERKLEEYKEQPKLDSNPNNFSDIIKQMKQRIQKLSKLSFNLTDQEDIQLMEKLVPYKMPPLQCLTLSLSQDIQNIKLLDEFLSNSICDEICYTSPLPFIKKIDTIAQTYPLSMTPYMACLTKMLPLASQEVSFCDSSFLRDEFEDILVAAKNTKQVTFQGCEIEVDDPLDFGDRLEGATFEGINFTGSKFKSDREDGEARFNYVMNFWARDLDDETKFRNIVEGLARVESVKNRHITMYMGSFNVGKEKGKKILEEYGLKKISFS
ncbi:unnamed protein product [Moneuplotes crassus]|uniref:Uncharacterized protein n=1 Tax=Euplotes crassus TaxID=5936 RepID=A0AAD1XG71_EUPCR|nr:unnamed protein product [Moneuplotes crassus]